MGSSSCDQTVVSRPSRRTRTDELDARAVVIARVDGTQPAEPGALRDVDPEAQPPRRPRREAALEHVVDAQPALARRDDLRLAPAGGLGLEQAAAREEQVRRLGGAAAGRDRHEGGRDRQQAHRLHTKQGKLACGARPGKAAWAGRLACAMVPACPSSFRRRLLALTAAALGVRLLWVALEPATYPVADETMWLSWGLHTLPSPEVHFSPFALRFIFHPPLYLYFIGVLQAAFGTLVAVKVGQCLLGASLVPALALRRPARLGRDAPASSPAAIAAFYPELVWFCSHFWAETLFTVLLWWAMERLTAADDERASSRAAAVAGVLFGLAVLTRETVLYFVPFAALWLAWRGAASPADGASRGPACGARPCSSRRACSSCCPGPCATGSSSAPSCRCRRPAP